jgi:GntR family transcriptional regulator
MHSEIVISKADGRPMYVQILEQIKERVAVGDWPRGGEIPSIRQLAVSLRVSVITVKRAYLELEREGVIVTQHGKGSFVALQADLRPRLFEKELTQLLEQVSRLGLLLGLTPDALLDRLRRAIEDANGSRVAESELTEEQP